MIFDFGESALLEISGIPPSVKHCVSSGQKENWREVDVKLKLSSSAGVRKGRTMRYRWKDLKYLIGERQCESGAVKMEVLLWLPASTDIVLPWFVLL